MDEPVEELSESECWSLLRTVGVGRVAMTGEDDDIDVFPINFVVDHGTVVFRTASGTKLATISEHPRVTFEADRSDIPTGVAWSVMVKGDAEHISARDDLVKLFALDVVPAHPAPKPYFVRVVPHRVTGRSFAIAGDGVV